MTNTVNDKLSGNKYKHMDIIKELDTLSEGELSELESILKITSDMRIHISKYPIYELEKRHYNQGPNDKPQGFWYGFGKEWINWIESEDPKRKIEHVYEVDIDGSNILKIKNYSELAEFTKEHVYEVDIDGSNILKIKNYSELAEFTKEHGSGIRENPRIIFFIDWYTIGLRYDGIEINPYIWQARLDTKFLWYYGWDIASGCIWNLDKVKISQI